MLRGERNGGASKAKVGRRSHGTRAIALTLALLEPVSAFALSTTPQPKPAGETPLTPEQFARQSLIDQLNAQALGYASSPSGYVAPGAPTAVAPGDLAKAITLVGSNQGAAAYAVRNGLSSALDRKIVDWLLIRAGDGIMSSAMITQFAQEAPNWPTMKMFRLRAEQALQRENPSPDEVIRIFNGSKPESVDGARLYARALAAKGMTAAAAQVIRETFTTSSMTDLQQKQIVTEFGSFLRPADVNRRVEMLLFAEKGKQAQMLDPLLTPAERTYVDARAAVVREAPDAAKLMAAVPASMRNRAGYKYSLVQLARRDGRYEDAAQILLSVPNTIEVQIDPGAWWDERKMVSRKLLDMNDPRTAYKLVANALPGEPVEAMDAEFHAGWYALRFLNDPNTAAKHFSRLVAYAKTPISVARGQYWWGRAEEARGNRGGAAQHYKVAAAYGMTFYGQLARERLGLPSAGVGGIPQPTGADKAAFQKNDMVRAIMRLAQVGAIDKTYPLFDQLANTMTTPGQVTLLANLANQYGKYHFALQVAKTAQNRGMPVAGLAFPVSGIPRSAKVPPTLERPVVYGIARQESVFNPGAVSPAGARGLLQLMPATAQITARKAGLPFAVNRLTSDPAYNATLGAYHLNELVDQFNGSYIMTFAAYNAGPRRVSEWIAKYGDPRDPRVDAIDWVERIPFTETRNYVQRVMENVQVYREQLGTGRLTIQEDLKRGQTGG